MVFSESRSGGSALLMESKIVRVISFTGRTKTAKIISAAGAADSKEEAVRLANDNEYGLAARIWTRDVDRPLRVAREIDAGMVWINDWAVSLDEFEEGGFKRSGNGRLNDQAGIDDFLECKHIAFNSGVIGSAARA